MKQMVRVMTLDDSLYAKKYAVDYIAEFLQFGRYGSSTSVILKKDDGHIVNVPINHDNIYFEKEQ
jgi:hypothetical protein